MQLASLIYDRNCHLCGRPRSSMVDYAVRRRLCRSCKLANVCPASAIETDVPNLHPLAIECSLYTMRPPADRKQTGFYCLPDVQALNDQLHAHAALASKEVNGEAAPFLQLADGRTFTTLDVFVAQRRRIVTASQMDAPAIEAWVRVSTLRFAQADEAARIARRAAIKERLLALGYSEWDFNALHENGGHNLVEEPVRLNTPSGTASCPGSSRSLRTSERRRTLPIARIACTSGARLFSPGGAPSVRSGRAAPKSCSPPSTSSPPYLVSSHTGSRRTPRRRLMSSGTPRSPPFSRSSTWRSVRSRSRRLVGSSQCWLPPERPSMPSSQTSSRRPQRRSSRRVFSAAPRPLLHRAPFSGPLCCAARSTLATRPTRSPMPSSRASSRNSLPSSATDAPASSRVTTTPRSTIGIVSAMRTSRGLGTRCPPASPSRCSTLLDARASRTTSQARPSSRTSASSSGATDAPRSVPFPNGTSCGRGPRSSPRTRRCFPGLAC
ncbi:hypothetical protein DMC30DRAFT_14355 [Rhodotorula diobovata]|uniref:Uncharacterized protein n=1 Tax=Rhodotorula diobovata TaxID=5288 RepID=A0A5C5FQS3_9BASI|nr:hypothetical protein DMC30DRAFT_14355 [Rhodotorula diobovata]